MSIFQRLELSTEYLFFKIYK